MAFTALCASTALFATALVSLPVCPASAPLSCHNTTAIRDKCCTEVQGQVLQVQLWDTDPATGPSDHWGIHGLWPDFCDGSYTSYCDESRQYTNISCILESYGKYDLLAYMREFWKNDNGDDEEFWQHEWGKHGTCYTTLQPSCFPHYTPQEEVVAFFEQVVHQFDRLPTYTYLAAAGILPSTTETYTNARIMAALNAARGVNATIECDDDELYQVEYTFNVQGSVADGVFVPAEPVGEGNGCPSEGIKYLPKNESSTPTVKNTETCASGLSAEGTTAMAEYYFGS
ncbi:ribonuclease T2 [Teratosphaeria destructans]|uniref:ribonuclease T2 n=1 Tax=Teratosphaeria destructans TaxID=418781 RepID=A0A9W7VYP4_9PEZI|nr:ribonuclease T2 [Teratosphaeria destructans]